MPHRPILATAALAAALAALVGCAHPAGPPSAQKVTTALATLQANPDTVRVEFFLAQSPRTGQVSRQVLLLVPAKTRTGYKIVDSQGDIFDDYHDFLANNTLPDQPGPG